MNERKCFFIGHRDAPAIVYPQLIAAIREHIVKYGVTEFIVGHYGQFDRMAARAVADLKKEFPQIKLTMLLPYSPSERKVEIPAGFDGSLYPFGMETVPRRLAIVRANRYAVDHVDYLIAYVRNPASNTAELVEYAKKKKEGNKSYIVLL